MKKEELFQALHEVDEAFLDENVTEIKHSTGWVTAVFSIAACAALTAGLIYFVPKPARNTESLPAEEIKVMHSETTVTTVAETVTAVSADWNDNTSVNEEYQLYDNSPEIITETTVTSIPVLKTTTVMENTHKNSESETSALVVETSGNLAPTHLPYITTENETQPSPSVLPNIQDNEPRQIETHYFETKPETTVKTTTTVTTTELPKETEPVTETPEIPEYIQNIMYESDADGGTVFAREEDEHIEIAVENGYYAESKFANALTYYPGKKYWVSMQVFYRDSDKEGASIDQILTLNYGIDVRYCRINDGRFLALITEDDLETLRQIENMGFLIDLAPAADIEDNEFY